MKKRAFILLTLLPFLLTAGQIGFVNFKTIVDESKLGKQEQATFEGLKDQMEKVLEEKEKEINQLADKLNDPDALDAMTPEAETEMKRKFRLLGQEFSEKQAQFYQALQQAHLKITAKIGEFISKASATVAKNKGFDAIFNNDAAFFTSEKLDLSKEVIQELDNLYAEELKKNPVTP